MHVRIANPRWRGKRSRRIHNPHLYVYGKRPMGMATCTSIPNTELVLGLMKKHKKLPTCVPGQAFVWPRNAINHLSEDSEKLHRSWSKTAIVTHCLFYFKAKMINHTIFRNHSSQQEWTKPWTTMIRDFHYEYTKNKRVLWTLGTSFWSLGIVK